MGIDYVADGAMLSRYAAMLVQWWRFTAKVERHGATMVVKRKRSTLEVPRPEFGMARKLDATLLAFERRFGLSPSDRAGIGIATNNAQNKADPGEALLARRRGS